MTVMLDRECASWGIAANGVSLAALVAEGVGGAARSESGQWSHLGWPAHGTLNIADPATGLRTWAAASLRVDRAAVIHRSGGGQVSAGPVHSPSDRSGHRTEGVTPGHPRRQHPPRPPPLATPGGSGAGPRPQDRMGGPAWPSSVAGGQDHAALDRPRKSAPGVVAQVTPPPVQVRKRRVRVGLGGRRGPMRP